MTSNEGSNLDEFNMDAHSLDNKLKKPQIAVLEQLHKSEKFRSLKSNLESKAEKWVEFYESPTAELCVPEPWRSGHDPSVNN
jgi:hypothetical protein